MPLADLPMQPVLEIVGVYVAAMAGALAAVRKQFDVFGILVLGWAAGLGGGVMRDVLIGVTPPVGVSDWRLVVTALFGGLTMYFLHPRLERARRVIILLDAGALAVFTVVGAVKGLEHGTTLVAAVIVGLVTGVGGGVLRDILTAEVPVVLHHRQLYAVPALLGASLLAVLWSLGALTVVWEVGIVLGILGLRVLALRYRLNAPGPWRGTGAGWTA